MDIQKVSRRLTLEEVVQGYRRGLFPMASEELGLITWHRPARRAILPLDGFHVSRSLARRIRRGGFTVTVNRAFAAVMAACAERPSTWISREFHEVYGALHRQGKAHSVEVWVEDRLAGGVYGVHLGGGFFAESMFHRATDMSKVALRFLVERLREREFLLLEAQYLTEHLARLGAVEITDRAYLRRLEKALAVEREFIRAGEPQQMFPSKEQ